MRTTSGLPSPAPSAPTISSFRLATSCSSAPNAGNRSSPDERPLVSQLSKRYEVLVALRDLGLPEGASACGKPDCGNSGGGCTTCATGGGCASGCGSKGLANDVREYFSGLRQQMEKSQRVPLA